jgi:hypothetical protein
MIIGKALYNILSNDIDVAAIVGSQVFPELAPANLDAPYVVYSIISNSPSDVKEETSSLDVANIEVYCFELSYNLAIDLGVAVRKALDRVGGIYNGVRIQSIQYTNEQMDVNESRQLWASIQDYSIRIKTT